jgi:Fe-S-cluster containining protein
MSIELKVQLVEKLFDRLENEITNFKSETNIHCLTGCGQCCSKPDINASPLEFLPWAFYLFLNGKAEAVLEELNTKTATFCHLYQSLSTTDNKNGRCTDYKYRGLICRLFGYAASRDKYGKLRLATCKIIKENQQENYDNTEEAISKGLYVPIFSDYYMRLTSIDNRLATTLLPINESLKMAIEEVLHYYAYRPFPGGLENIA